MTSLNMSLSSEPIRLHYRPVEVRGTLPPGVQHVTAEVERASYDMFDALQGRLRGYVLAHEVDVSTHQVATIFRTERPTGWLDYIKVGLQQRWPRLFGRLRPKFTVERQRQYATAWCRQHATFPDATVIFPKELGGVVWKHEWVDERGA